MATRIMVVWILILQVFWACVFIVFVKHFDGAEFEKLHVAYLEKQLHQNNRVLARMEMNFSEYKDAIAMAGVKIKDNTKWNDPKRVIASVMAEPEFKSIPQMEPGTLIFNKARKLYVAGDYKRTAEILGEFVQNYADYPNLPEAYFLLGESDFYTGQLEQSVKSIDALVTHFPETEFAGYGLVRLGHIFEKQERPEEAEEMYNVVIDNYPRSNAAAIAEKSKKDLNL